MFDVKCRKNICFETIQFSIKKLQIKNKQINLQEQMIQYLENGNCAILSR